MIPDEELPDLAEEARARRRRKGRTALAVEGKPLPGPAPFGYMRRDGELLIVEHAANVVRRCFELYGTGDVTTREIALYLSGETGRKWTKQTARYLLRNPIYAGIVRCDGQDYEGTHVPIVSREVWKNVQTLLSENRRNKS